MASRLPSLLPDTEEAEALQLAAIASVSGEGLDPRRWRQRPFRAPHHSASAAALVGGGNPPCPAGPRDCTVTTPELKEKIYRFINKYSHSDVIEITEESAENLAGESHSVIGNIFQWMEEVDKKHYDEMVQVATT